MYIFNQVIKNVFLKFSEIVVLIQFYRMWYGYSPKFALVMFLLFFHHCHSTPLNWTETWHHANQTCSHALPVPGGMATWPTILKPCALSTWVVFNITLLQHKVILSTVLPWPVLCTCTATQEYMYTDSTAYIPGMIHPGFKFSTSRSIERKKYKEDSNFFCTSSHEKWQSLSCKLPENHTTSAYILLLVFHPIVTELSPAYILSQCSLYLIIPRIRETFSF